jgi:hypothetical protein
MTQGSFLSHEPSVWQGVDLTDTYQLAALRERSRCHKSSPASLPVKTESVLKVFSMGLLSRSSERITQSFATWVGENGTVRSRSGDVRRSTNCPARACTTKSVPPLLFSLGSGTCIYHWRPLQVQILGVSDPTSAHVCQLLGLVSPSPGRPGRRAGFPGFALEAGTFMMKP